MMSVSTISVAVVGPDSCHDLHVVPEFEGEREHETTIACWCSPVRDREQPLVIVHHRRAEA